MLMAFKKISFETDDRIKLILIGSVSLILMQATIHIGVNIRLFPTTGMTLPFLSYGGSSIISTSILAGIILNLTKRKINRKYPYIHAGKKIKHTTSLAIYNDQSGSVGNEES